MSFPNTTTHPTMIPTDDLTSGLARLGLRSTAEGLDDLIARATRQRLAPLASIEEIVRLESSGRASRKQERLLSAARIGRFKPMDRRAFEQRAARVERGRTGGRAPRGRFLPVLTA
ncbi:MAG: hypothetical protein ACREAB_03210 [Blastocatellia bacterium]